MRFSIQIFFNGKCILESFLRFTSMAQALTDIDNFMTGWSKVETNSDVKFEIFVRMEWSSDTAALYINKEGFTTIPFNWSKST